MSHFFTVVIMPKKLINKRGEADPSVIGQEVEKLLAPYDEGLEVPEYEKPCWCVNRIAKREAEIILVKEQGNWDEVRDKFNAVNCNLSPEEQHKKWEKEVYEPREKRIRELTRKHPMYNKPDPKCSECKGSGIEKTKYNPRSKWDWYVIGGRWDGEITGKARPSRDNGFNFGDEHHQVSYNNNKVNTMIEKKVIPYALVTPRGKWVQRGQMGWWGMSSDEESPEEWTKRVLKLYEKYKDNIAIGVDMHI